MRVALTTRTASALVRILPALKPSRAWLVAGLELAGIGGVCYGISGWSIPAAWVAGGVGLVLEAYAVEKR